MSYVTRYICSPAAHEAEEKVEPNSSREGKNRVNGQFNPEFSGITYQLTVECASHVVMHV